MNTLAAQLTYSLQRGEINVVLAIHNILILRDNKRY
jgi:hypothetical protein